MFLVEILVGIDSAKEASELIDSNSILMLATMTIPPPINTPRPRCKVHVIRNVVINSQF